MLQGRRLGIDIGALKSTDRHVEGVVEMNLERHESQFARIRGRHVDKPLFVLFRILRDAHSLKVEMVLPGQRGAFT